jgi:hypothetical protein
MQCTEMITITVLIKVKMARMRSMVSAQVASMKNSRTTGRKSPMSWKASVNSLFTISDQNIKKNCHSSTLKLEA